MITFTMYKVSFYNAKGQLLENVKISFFSHLCIFLLHREIILQARQGCKKSAGPTKNV